MLSGSIRCDNFKLKRSANLELCPRKIRSFYNLFFSILQSTVLYRHSLLGPLDRSLKLHSLNFSVYSKLPSLLRTNVITFSGKTKKNKIFFSIVHRPISYHCIIKYQIKLNWIHLLMLSYFIEIYTFWLKWFIHYIFVFNSFMIKFWAIENPTVL